MCPHSVPPYVTSFVLLFLFFLLNVCVACVVVFFLLIIIIVVVVILCVPLSLSLCVLEEMEEAAPESRVQCSKENEDERNEREGGKIT